MPRLQLRAKSTRGALRGYGGRTAPNASPERIEEVCHSKVRGFFLSDSTVATIAVAGISAVPSILAAVFGFLNQRRTAQMAETARQNHAETKQMISDVQETTNGKMEKLLEVTGASQRALGVLEGKADKE